MKRIIAFLLAIILITTFSACAMTSDLNEVTTAPTEVMPSESSSPTETQAELPEDLQIDQVAVSCATASQDYFSEDDVLLFQNKYPVINLVADNAQTVQRITNHFSAFVNNPQITEEIQNILSYANENYSPESFWSPYTLNVTLDAQRLDNRILSMFGSVDNYAGGPHPNHYLISVNYSMETGDTVSLLDILTDQNALDTLCEKVLTDFSNAGENIYLFDDYVDVVIDHFDHNSEKFSSWYLSDTGLCVYFSVYEVSAYASGDFIFEYPYSELEGILKEEYLISENGSQDGDGTLSIQLQDSTDIVDKKLLGSLTLTDDGPKVLVSATDDIFDVCLDQGHWTNGGTEFAVTRTLFRSNILNQESFFKIQSMLPETYSTLRIRYSTKDGTQYKYLAANYADETIQLLDGPK